MTKFENWTPACLIEYHKWCSSKPDDWDEIDRPCEEHLDALYRTLTYRDMRSVWKTLQQLSDPAVLDGVQGYAKAIMEVLAMMNTLDQVSSGQRRAMFEESAKRIRKIAHDLSEVTDGIIHSHYNYHYVGKSPTPGLPIASLTSFAGHLERCAGQLHSMIKQPRSSDAGKHFMIRSLSAYLSATYGKPLHTVVAATTNAVFDCTEITEERVRKLVNEA